MDNKAIEKQLGIFKATCRKAGLKVTPQRLEIYREVVGSEDHPSAEALHMRLVKKVPTLSLDTVYRTMAGFSRHGLIQKVDTVARKARFDANCERHHHAVCRQCHKIIDFHCPSVDALKLPKDLMSWGEIERRNLVVYSLCNHCLKTPESG